MAKRPPIGPTGRFPHGKLRPDDEGELAAAITTRGRMIEIHFGTPTRWLALTPELAREFAAVLLERAAKIDGRGGASG